MHLYSNPSNANAAAKKFIAKYPGKLTLAAPERGPGVTAVYYGGVYRVKDVPLTDEEVKDITNTVRLLDADTVTEEVQDAPPPPKRGGPRAKRAKAKGKADKPKSKLSRNDEVTKLCQRKGGVTAQELMDKYDWQPHSVRGFFSHLNKARRAAKLPEIVLTKVEGKPSTYLLAE